jgi:ATP-dependent Lon protease
MYFSKKDHKLRHYLKHKAKPDQEGSNQQNVIDLDRLPEVIEIFNVMKMHAMLKEHGPKSNLYRNHQRYLGFLEGTAGYLPFSTLSDDIFEKLDDLESRFPNFALTLDFYREQFALALLTDQATFCASPVLLIGPAGVGKSAFCYELAKIVNTHFSLINLASTTAGFILSGMSSGWADGKPGIVVQSLAKGRRADPLIVLDEIDKVGGDHRYDPLGSLYQLLEKQSAASFVDEALEVATDCSHINWIATANDAYKIPEPILSRFTVIEISRPSKLQMKKVVGSIYQTVRENHKWGSKFSDTLSESVVNKIINSELEPRLVQRELISACGKVAIRRSKNRTTENGLCEILPEDFEPRAPVQPKMSLVLPVHPITPAQKESEEVITEEVIILWSIKEVLFNDHSENTRHLVGHIPRMGSERVTSAIKSFDRNNMQIQTMSGRTYDLIGQPGCNSAGDEAWDIWKAANNVKEDLDVTGQYCLVH